MYMYSIYVLWTYMPLVYWYVGTACIYMYMSVAAVAMRLYVCTCTIMHVYVPTSVTVN